MYEEYHVSFLIQFITSVYHFRLIGKRNENRRVVYMTWKLVKNSHNIIKHQDSL